MGIGDRIRQRRIELDMTQIELAHKLGYKSKAAISTVENNKEEFTTKRVERYAKALDTTPSYLMGWTNDPNKTSSGLRIPVLGRVAAGIPIEAIEDIYDYEDIPDELARRGKYFGLMIHGDSMTPELREDDVVIVREQPDAENGDTVIATVNGNDACCKRLIKYSDGIQLISNNPAYAPMIFSNEEIEKKPVRILGVVVESRRKWKQ